MSKRTETAWAIAHPNGLYCGHAYTRRAAIAHHVWMGRLSSDPEPNQFVWGRGLSSAQLTIWNRMKKNGDYAVKIKITYRARRVSQSSAPTASSKPEIS